MKRGKKYQSASEKIDKNKIYSIEEAIKLIKENKVAKFDESIEVHARLNIDPKKGDQQIRGAVVFPHSFGKGRKIAVITSTKEKEAKDAGVDIIGGEELIEKIKAGKIEFEILIATPEMMPKLAQVAKVLGPKGLMPSPKTETVTNDVKKIVGEFKKGKANFKNDDTGNVHQIVGKVSLEDEKIIENLKTFFEALNKAKTDAVKGKLVERVVICSTMGPGLKISL